MHVSRKNNKWNVEDIWWTILGLCTFEWPTLLVNVMLHIDEMRKDKLNYETLYVAITSTTTQYNPQIPYFIAEDFYLFEEM